MLDYSSILVPLSWPAPHSSKTISAVQTKSRLMTEQHRGPVSSGPVHMILSPGQSSPTFLSEWNTNAGSSVAKNDIMQSVPNSLDADIGSRGVQEVKTKGPSIAEPISTGLKSNKTVFSMSCCSLSATCMSSHGCTKRVVPDPSPGNHTLRNTKDICHMSLLASYLKHSNTRRQFITRQMASLTLLRHYQKRVSIKGPQREKSHPLIKF